MDTLVSAAVILVILLVPRLLVLLSDKHRAFGFLGPVLLCYAAGIILGLILNGLSADTSIASAFVNYTIPVAIPLILFSANYSSLRQLAKKTVISFLLMCVSVVAVSVLGFFIFRGRLPEAEKLAGMMTGLYTGGTPNLYAIGSALHASDTAIAQSVAVDTIVGGIYFFLLISVMPPLARRLLGRQKPAGQGEAPQAGMSEQAYLHTRQYFSPRAFLRRMPAVGLAVLCFAVSAGAALLITGSLDDQWVVAIVMLGVTTLGIALSFVKRVRAMSGSYDTGQYFIYMFSLAMGLTLDLGSIGSGILWLALFIIVALHLLLARVFSIDAETALITSTAGIYGPAFVTPVANALGSRDVIVPGLVCGIFGYAVGNYIGCLVGIVLGWL